MAEICDIHAHFFHPRWYPAAFCDAVVKDYCSRSGGRLVATSNSTQSAVMRVLSDETGNGTLRVMDRTGIGTRVILIVDWGLVLGEAPASIREVHRAILGVCAMHPDRFIGFAGVDPRRPDAVELLEWAFDDLRARGLKLHPTGEWALGDDETHRVVSMAASRGLPTLVHVGKTMSILDKRNADPMALIDLAKAFPTALFIAGHSGFQEWRRFAAYDGSNIHFDVSGWQEWWRREPEVVHMELMSILTTFPGRVHFGSDSPFFTYNNSSSEAAWVKTVRAAAQETKLNAYAQAEVFRPTFLLGN